MKPVHTLPWLAVVAAACTDAPVDDEDDALGGTQDSGTAEVCGVDAEVGLEVGECAPDFTMPDANDQPFTLSSMRGKVALVDISAVW